MQLITADSRAVCELLIDINKIGTWCLTRLTLLKIDKFKNVLTSI